MAQKKAVVKPIMEEIRDRKDWEQRFLVVSFAFQAI